MNMNTMMKYTTIMHIDPTQVEASIRNMNTMMKFTTIIHIDHTKSIGPSIKILFL